MIDLLESFQSDSENGHVINTTEVENNSNKRMKKFAKIYKFGKVIFSE